MMCQLVDVAKCATSNLNGGVPVDLVCEVEQWTRFRSRSEENGRVSKYPRLLGGLRTSDLPECSRGHGGRMANALMFPL